MIATRSLALLAIVAFLVIDSATAAKNWPLNIATTWPMGLSPSECARVSTTYGVPSECCPVLVFDDTACAGWMAWDRQADPNADKSVFSQAQFHYNDGVVDLATGAYVQDWKLRRNDVNLACSGPLWEFCIEGRECLFPGWVGSGPVSRRAFSEQLASTIATSAGYNLRANGRVPTVKATCDMIRIDTMGKSLLISINTTGIIDYTTGRTPHADELLTSLLRANRTNSASSARSLINRYNITENVAVGPVPIPETFSITDADTGFKQQADAGLFYTVGIISTLYAAVMFIFGLVTWRRPGCISK